jgi:hypothetical protein
MIRSKDFLRDYNSGRNAEEARALKWWILNHVRENGMVTADEIYEESGCGDIAMYLALHELVTNKLLEGQSPYDDALKGTNHLDWFYSIAKNGDARFFADAARVSAGKWNADDWTAGVTPIDPTLN